MMRRDKLVLRGENGLHMGLNGEGFLSVLHRVKMLVFAVLALIMLFGIGARAQTPQPEKVDKLIELLSDPAVKSWLEDPSKHSTVAAATAEPDSPALMLSSQVTMIREHFEMLLNTIPLLPAQFDRAWNILLLEFEGNQLLGLFALLALFIASGFGFDWLVRRLTTTYRVWMVKLPWDTPAGRSKSFLARILYASIMAGAYIIGSLWVFIVFNWPPLLREILLAYLTVAILVRLTMMFSRAVFVPPHIRMPHGAEFRALPVSDAGARHWYIWLAIIIGWYSFVGVTFGILKTFGFTDAGREVLGIPASFILLTLALLAVWRRPRLPPAAGQKPPKTGHDMVSWLFTLYLVLLWALWTAGSWPFFWGFLAAVGLPLAVRLVHRAVHHLARPAEGVEEADIVAPVYLAIVDRGIRVVLIAATAYALARAWGIGFSTMDQMDSTQTRLLRGLLNAAVIVIAAEFGWTVIKAVISHKRTGSHGATGDRARQEQARLRTLLPIIQNILFAVLLGVAVLMVLSTLGIEIGPLIAGAGVAGVAIGFGAQTLVKDVISGIFYLFDDAFRIGEYVESGTFKGTVESFSLRSVKLRHHRGYLFTVPFGLLGAVQNMSRDWVIEKFNITVGYDTDIDKARKLIKKIGLDLAADPEFAPFVIEPLKMQGVQDFGDYGIQIRIKMMTLPGEQFTMKRKAYILIKAAFEQNGITIPVPTVQVKGDDPSAGAAAASQLLRAQAAAAAVPGS